MRRLLAKPKFHLWLAVVGASTLVLGAAYAMVQQSTRQSANDVPLLQSQNISAALADGSSPADVISGKQINLHSGSIAPFVIITDDSYHVVASSATLNGKTPLPPSGVFEYTKTHGSDTFTWQPDAKVRLATHVTTYNANHNSGYIITGQSLGPFEDRVQIYTALAGLAWLGVIAWTTFVLLLPSMLSSLRTSSRKQS